MGKNNWASAVNTFLNVYEKLSLGKTLLLLLFILLFAIGGYFWHEGHGKDTGQQINSSGSQSINTNTNDGSLTVNQNPPNKATAPDTVENKKTREQK